VWHQPLAAPAAPGHPDPTNARSVLSMLETGCDACATGAFDALVTAPVQKSSILDAGIAFSGHTEFFAARTHTPRVVMMLAAGSGDAALRVALVTTHLALRAVPDAITEAAVGETLAIVRRELMSRFRIAAPRIAVCGLNPHAGEGGHLGREELDVIAPAVAKARADGADVTGPLPADTVFVRATRGEFDAVIACYHDQGLIPIKMAAFGKAVNVTLGLPIIRTSVDHGTAFDIAGKGVADPGSLIEAILLAARLAGAGTRQG
jgi:4-hydroxythreonine-4-phosphate dehydrogenase